MTVTPQINHTSKLWDRQPWNRSTLLVLSWFFLNFAFATCCLWWCSSSRMTHPYTQQKVCSQENVSNEDRMKGDRRVDQEEWRRPKKGNNPTAGSIFPAGRIKRSSARVPTKWPPVGQWCVLARQAQDRKDRCVSTVTMLAWWSEDSLMAAQTSTS